MHSGRRAHSSGDAPRAGLGTAPSSLGVTEVKLNASLPARELDVTGGEDDECIHGLTALTCSLCKAPKAAPSSQKGWSRPSSASGRKTPENSTSYFGHPWSEWFAMRDAGIECILQCARERRTTTYHQLWPEIERNLGVDLGNPWRQMPNLLGYISEQSCGEFRLLLTALVIEEGSVPQPGEGFFRLAAAMGLLAERDAPPEGVPWRGMTELQRTFWEEQVETIFTRFAG